MATTKRAATYDTNEIEIFSSPEEMSRSLQRQENKDKFVVTYNSRLYDIADFLPDHPGGKELLVNYNKKDITDAFTKVHSNSVNAKRILAQYKIGELTESIQSKDDEEKPYPLRVGRILQFKDFTIDLSKGYFYQIWKLSKKQYTEVIMNPVVVPFYVPLFDNKYLDLTTTTQWYVVLIVWIPVTLYFLHLGLATEFPQTQAIDNYVRLDSASFSYVVLGMVIAFGLLVWSLLEYTLHRFLFHMEKWMPDKAIFRYLAFIIHGVHHALPADGGRLVFPPVLGYIVYHILAPLVFSILPGNTGAIFAAAVIVGYMHYDMTHYYLHHSIPVLSRHKMLKSAHNKHHYLDDSKGFGISNKLWDDIFGTQFH